jgi:hypothetical protein
MCRTCDRAERAPREYLAHLQGVIATRGWASIGVERSRLHPPVTYSVGLTGHGQPEVVVTGLPIPFATQLLDAVAAAVLRAGAPLPGERVMLPSGTPIEIVKVADATARLKVAAEVFGPGIQALQAVHADDRGHWPWDARYRGIPGGQPILGLRQPAPTGTLPRVHRLFPITPPPRS